MARGFAMGVTSGLVGEKDSSFPIAKEAEPERELRRLKGRARPSAPGVLQQRAPGDEKAKQASGKVSEGRHEDFWAPSNRRISFFLPTSSQTRHTRSELVKGPRDVT